MVAAWFSVILASGAFAIELAFSSGWANFLQTLSWMALVHAGIGLGEAVVTGLVLRFILLTRPDLVYQPEATALAKEPPRWWALIGAGLGIALAVCIFLAPFASEYPDGLEYVGGKLGFIAEDAPALISAPIPDYSLPLLGAANVKAATALAGLVGTLIVFAVGLVLARVFAKPQPVGVDPDAA
jgi:cobalt/nickel transport system permease protein